MYEIIKNVIKNKNFELKDILKKIDTIWLQNEITEEQKQELNNLARDNANIDISIDILNKLKELDLRVTNLEKNESVEEPTEPELYPEYVTGKWYYNNDKCSENGKNYICIAPEGQICVWSPSEYPTYWQEVTEL